MGLATPRRGLFGRFTGRKVHPVKTAVKGRSALTHYDLHGTLRPSYAGLTGLITEDRTCRIRDPQRNACGSPKTATSGIDNDGHNFVTPSARCEKPPAQRTVCRPTSRRNAYWIGLPRNTSSIPMRRLEQSHACESTWLHSGSFTGRPAQHRTVRSTIPSGNS